jgi:hypothetical protein
MYPSNSCNADAIGTAEEKTVQVAQSFSKLTEVYKAEESTSAPSDRFCKGTVDSFHDTPWLEVAASVETIAARAVVDSPVKVFPEQKED